jgi:hypothetical protein
MRLYPCTDPGAANLRRVDIEEITGDGDAVNFGVANSAARSAERATGGHGSKARIRISSLLPSAKSSTLRPDSWRPQSTSLWLRSVPSLT